jgi:uncharacterized protein (DUF1800 family)
MASDQVRRQVGHLLRRAGFGANKEETERCVAQGVAATVDEMVDFERIPDNLDETLRQVNGGLLDVSTLEDAQTWWLYRMVHSPRPLQEKMTFFWHGHFATANHKVNSPAAMHDQNQLFRRQALGNFQTLALEVSKDPAMLLWLDNNSNRKAAPNENYARELMELFTLGLGTYSERDVAAVARAFTGWSLTPARPGPRTFVFNANQHDAGMKTILGRTGRWNGDDALGIILAQPAHATWMATKLFRFFAYDSPEPEVIAPLAALYRDSQYEVKPLVKAILLSEAFYSEKAYQQHVKTPVDYVVETVRTLDMPVRIRGLLPMLAAMGQELYNPPHVGGWPSGRGWINPSTLLERFNAAMRLTAFTGQQPTEGGRFDPAEMVQRYNFTTWEQAVDALLGAFIDRAASPALRGALLNYVGGATLDPRGLDVKLRGLVHLILTSAESQTS